MTFTADRSVSNEHHTKPAHYEHHEQHNTANNANNANSTNNANTTAR